MKENVPERIRILFLLSLILIILTVPPATSAEVKIIHGPRLGLVTANTATITWDTNEPGIGQIEWGTSEIYTSSAEKKTATTNHRFTLTNLSPATTYHYRIKTSTASSRNHTFLTAVSPGIDFTFISMADCRGETVKGDLKGLPKAFSRIIEHAASKNAGFAVFVGDMFYGSIELKEQKKLYHIFKTATDLLAVKIPFIVNPGNHEMSPPNKLLLPPQYDPLKLFNQEFAQPHVLKGYPGTVFSWDWGNSHFASVDTCYYNEKAKDHGMYYLSDKVIEWLEKDLKEAEERNARHIFVFGHTHAFRPERSNWHVGYLGTYPGQRDKLWSVLAKYKVDAYICGHQHLFNDQFGRDGVVQWINGNSGCITQPKGGRGLNQWTLWKIQGNIATAELINDLGEIQYTRILHGSRPTSKKKD